MKEANYTKAAMAEMLSVLPYGTKSEIAKKLGLSQNVVANTCYGKQYNKAVVDEVERRYNQVKKSLASK